MEPFSTYVYSVFYARTTHASHPSDSVSGADLRACGDWRLYLVRQFSEIMELLGREGGGGGSAADGPDLEAPVTSAKACPITPHPIVGTLTSARPSLQLRLPASLTGL